MSIIDIMKNWMIDHPTLTMIIKFVLWAIFVVVVIHFARKFIRKSLPDTTVRYKTQKGIEIVGYFFLIVLALFYFTGNIQDFTLAIGLLSAGVAITLQELILSVAGSIYIYVVRVYKPGDRIEINGIKGDVIDVDSLYTTMMEIGEWVTSDNYSGRIVKLSNAFVFKGPIYNYSQDFPFIWDEFDLPIRYGSDVELAKEIVASVAQETLSEFTNESKEKWKNIVNQYYIEDALVDPTLAISLTDNWIQLNLRYIVDYKKRRATKNTLNEKIRERILNSDGKVVLASATYEIVNMPEVKIDISKQGEKQVQK